MALLDLKVTVTKVDGKCSRTRVGSTFYVRNARIEVPPGDSVCLFALGSLLPVLSSAMTKTTPGDSVLDVVHEWQCPDPLAQVRFRIEPAD